MQNKAIYLCGFMGCGKTTIGRRLAKMLGKDFTDLDNYIKDREGMEISEIFEKHGEQYFRKAETKALEELSQKSGVIATGGGALLSDENGRIAKDAGVVFFIDTPFEMCYVRIRNDVTRPIAYNSTKEELRARFEQRRPKYIKNSHYTIKGTGGPEAIANNIIEIYNMA